MRRGRRRAPTGPRRRRPRPSGVSAALRSATASGAQTSPGKTSATLSPSWVARPARAVASRRSPAGAATVRTRRRGPAGRRRPHGPRRRRPEPASAATIGQGPPAGLVWHAEACEGAAEVARPVTAIDRHRASAAARVVPARGAAAPAHVLACADPRRIGTGILGHVGGQRRELPGGEEHPFHAGNLPDPHGATGALAQVSVDLPRCADGDIRPLAHGSRAVEPVPGGDDGAGRARARAPRSGVPRPARRDERSPAQVFATSNALTLPVSGTGSAGMEASFVNFVRPGRRRSSSGVNGVFGERMCEVAGRLGAEVVRVDAPWGEPLDPRPAPGRPPGTGRSSRWCTPRPRPGCATTSSRSGRARVTRCSWSTW